MRTLDPRLLRRARGARFGLGVDIALGLLTTLTVLLQAVVFADIVSDAFENRLPTDGTIALLAALVAARALFAGGFEALGRRAGARVVSELRMTLVRRRLIEASGSAGEVEAAEATTLAVDGIDALESYFARYLPQLVLAVLVPPVVLVWSSALDPTSAAIMLVTIPLIPVFMVLIGRATEPRTRARWKALSRLSTHFLDVVRGLPTLRAFNRAETQAERIEAVSEEYRATTMHVLRVSFLSGAVLDLTATIATALVAVTLGIRLVDGDVAFRAAFTVLLITPELYAPLRLLAAQFHNSADGVAAAERILDLLDATTTQPGVDDPNGREAPARSAARGRVVGVPTPWEVVRLERVSFSYPGRPDPIVVAADLELRRGQIVALTGPSGAGKSTLASLLLGLIRPDSGAVTVDGVDLDRIDRAAWHRQLAWLPQHATMFRGSVHHNIAIGDPSASRDDVVRAARIAAADAFIRDLRHGYDTVIGDGGRGLSAGEARRVALARALLRPTPLLILDEPTANLDARTADDVLDAIVEEARPQAVVVIEHAPRRAMTAARVARLDRARLTVSAAIADRMDDPLAPAPVSPPADDSRARDAAKVRP